MNLEATLTKREKQVAEHIAWGASKKQIASKFFISTRTVENTARNIYAKVEINSKGELSAWWFCKTFNISQLFNPLLSLVFISLLVVNEINGDDSMVRNSRAKTCKARTCRARTGKRKTALL